MCKTKDFKEDASGSSECVLDLNLLFCSNIVLYEQPWSADSTAFWCVEGLKFMSALLVIWISRFTGAWADSFLHILLVFSSMGHGFASASSCRSKSTWQREVMLSEGTFLTWGSCGNETCPTDQLPSHISVL